MCRIMIMVRYKHLAEMLQQNQKKQRMPRNLPKNQESSIQVSAKRSSKSISPIHDPFFASKALNKKRWAEDSLTKGEKFKNSIKVAATDESSNNQESNVQESLEFFPKKLPNQEYFQPLSFRQKKLKPTLRRREPLSKKLEDLSIKMTEMSKMVHSQGKQIHNMKTSMSERELHRLLKMHSIEKLKLLSEIALVGSSRSKKQI